MPIKKITSHSELRSFAKVVHVQYNSAAINRQAVSWWTHPVNVSWSHVRLTAAAAAGSDAAHTAARLGVGWVN